MEETEFRTLDALASDLGSSLSISELTEEIKRLHGTAYYANIYRALQALAAENVITLTKSGRSSIASLNFGNYLLPDLLTQMELKRKYELLRKRKELQILLADLESQLRNMRLIQSISLIDAARNLPLNRLELLFLLSDELKEESLSDYALTLHDTTRRLQSTHNIKLDPLILTSSDLLGLLTSDEINPIKEMLKHAVTFFSPQSFWNQMARWVNEHYKISFNIEEMNPVRITERDLVYNLARFGYKEIGSEIQEGQWICIEYIITSIMMRDQARRIDAIPILLAKNQANYNLLIFQSKKYGFEGRLLGLLRVLDAINSTTQNERAVKLLEAMKAKEIEADKGAIQEYMRLYNAA